MCQDYGQCVFLGEVSAADQLLTERLADIIKHYRRRQCRPTLIDRVVLGIRSNVNSGGNNVTHLSNGDTNTIHLSLPINNFAPSTNESTLQSTQKEDRS